MNFLKEILGKKPPKKKGEEASRAVVEEEQEQTPPPEPQAVAEERPSVTQPGDPPRGLPFWVGRATDVGQVRERNEDALFTLEAMLEHNGQSVPFGLFIVADGMGGHKEGDLASFLAARIVAAHIVREIYLPLLGGAGQEWTQSPISEVLNAAVIVANEAIHRGTAGGGTTLTAALLMGDSVHIAHVGDSRAYILRDEKLCQVTKDHSLIARLLELGQLSDEEALIHPQRNVLYRALGQGEKMEVDTYFESIPPGGHLLLCSDGLWGMVSEAEMEAIISASALPQEACNTLIAAANEHGGEDNITVILVSMAH